jgi:hypothetical protein
MLVEDNFDAETPVGLSGFIFELSIGVLTPE